MDNFKVIYKILRHLEASMDCEYTDMDAISAERLKISPERWEALLILLQQSGYITGLAIEQSQSDPRSRICEPVMAQITLAGLEYLSENTMMKKASRM